MSYQKILQVIESDLLSDIKIATLKKMVLNLISEEESKKSNKVNNTVKLQKTILSFLKESEKKNKARPILAKCHIDENGNYNLVDGYMCFILNGSLKIEGIPLTTKADGEFLNCQKLFNASEEIEEKIDLSLLNEKLALYKANGKKVSTENGYIINNKYFNPTFVKYAVDILGTDLTLKHTNDTSVSPIEIVSPIGKGLIIPFRANK